MLAELGTYLTSLPDNPPPNAPHTVKLEPPLDINSSQWRDVYTIVQGFPNKYIVLDLSGCNATDDTVTGQVVPSGNDMNIINGTPNIKGIVLPSSLTNIGAYAFWECSGLTSMTISSGVTSIRESAFERCSGLTSITILSGVTSIGNAAFSDCSSLASITIPASVTSIGEFAFRSCTSLTSITISDNVATIGNGAFTNCTSLASVTIPNSVTSIGMYAFQNCGGLISVTLPAGITFFGNTAFPEGTGWSGNKLKDTYQAVGGGAGTYIWDLGVNNWVKQ